ncbi:MAG TPA: hypothetical protein VG452_05920 [Egibacteraceae bacterium]|nr:hypothetical protein [Actinomycetota bacterium]HWB71736.1 hypothetical protein [Egibacteraceae bacterium]
MAPVHHCPRCELRFANKSHLRDHLVLDHGLERADIEQHLAGEKGLRMPAPPLYDQPEAEDEAEEPQEPPPPPDRPRRAWPDDYGPYRAP